MLKQKKSNKKMFFIFAFVLLTLVLTLSLFLPFNLNIKNENLTVNQEPNVSQFASSSFEGQGTASDPYRISSNSDLANLRVDVNSGTRYSGTYFILTNNISIPGNNAWTPIGNSGNTFNGIFDGNGFTISDLKLAPSHSHLGLFGNIYNAKIVNLQLKNITAIGISTQTTYLGGLAGYANGDCTLSNIRITDSKLTMTAVAAAIHIGGLVGCSTADNLMIRKCESLNNDIGANVSGVIYTGGIIGAAQQKLPNVWNVIIENCKSTGIEFVSADFEGNIAIRSSFYQIDEVPFTYYGYGHKPSKQPIYSVDELLGYLNYLSPGIWYKDVNEIFIRGVGNVDFKLNTSDAELSVAYPFPLGYNRKITVTANTGNVISGITVFQNVYEEVWLYESSNLPDLKSKAQLGYLSKAGNKNAVDFNISDVFVKMANRQGFFSINLSLTPTSINVPIVERYFDITSNSWKQFASSSKELSQNQTVNRKLVSSENPNYNYTYLNAITNKYYEFTKSGSETISVTSLNFTFTLQHIEYIKSGYLLNVNYTNGFLFRIQQTPALSENYWFASTTNSICKLNNGVFNSVGTGSASPLILQNENYNFVGWSNTKPKDALDFYGRVDSSKYVPWKADFALQIKAVRANLTELNDNYNITGVEFSSFGNWNFENFSQTNVLTLYPIWGGDTIRLYAYVYSYFADTYHLKSTLYIDSTAQKVNNFYRLENNGNCSLSLKNANGTILDLSNGGYLDIDWYVAEIKDNEIYDLEGNEGDGFGELQVDEGNVTASISGMTRQTSVIVVLQPREDIGITLKLDELEVEHNMTFKINDEDIALNVTRNILVYGEEYVITIENLPTGYHLAEVKITNDVETIIKVNSRESSCTFLVDFVDDIELTLVLAEGLFFELLIYILAAISIVFLIIIIWLIVGNSAKRKNPDDENNAKPEVEK